MADHDSRPPNPSSGVLASSASTDVQDEQKMRRALGLNARGNSLPAQQRPEQARQRHRFVQDGGVPVVVLNHRTDESGALRERINELETQLEAERAAHAMARRTASEQQSLAQSLETRLAHAELAHREALAQEQRIRTTLQHEISLLQAASSSPAPAAPQAARPLAAARSVQTKTSDPAAAAPKKRGRPRIHPPKEPKPVRWWTPSFKATTKA